MDKELTKGIFKAAITVVETGIKEKTLSQNLEIAINCLPDEEKTKFANRAIAFFKEQIMLINQKPTTDATNNKI
jgi:hypothetical protein